MPFFVSVPILKLQTFGRLKESETVISDLKDTLNECKQWQI